MSRVVDTELVLLIAHLNLTTRFNSWCRMSCWIARSISVGECLGLLTLNSYYWSHTSIWPPGSIPGVGWVQPKEHIHHVRRSVERLVCYVFPCTINILQFSLTSTVRENAIISLLCSDFINWTGRKYILWVTDLSLSWYFLLKISSRQLFSQVYNCLYAYKNTNFLVGALLYALIIVPENLIPINFTLADNWKRSHPIGVINLMLSLSDLFAVTLAVSC